MAAQTVLLCENHLFKTFLLRCGIGKTRFILPNCLCLEKISVLTRHCFFSAARQNTCFADAAGDCLPSVSLSLDYQKREQMSTRSLLRGIWKHIRKHDDACSCRSLAAHVCSPVDDAE